MIGNLGVINQVKNLAQKKVCFYASWAFNTQQKIHMTEKIIRGGWKATLAQLMRTDGKYTADGKKSVSYATQQARREHLYRAFNDIRQLGFKVLHVKNITGKHVLALAKHYAERVQKGSLSGKTVQNRFSHLRTFSKWINKPGLIKPIDHYLDIPLKRPEKLETSRSWVDQGKDTTEVLGPLKSANKRVFDALLLQRHFGLRSKESILIRPHLADKGNILIVSHGTKGGRDRFVPIETITQREILDQIKNYIGKNESLVPKGESYENFRRKYYRTLARHGISRKTGITAHGLRHEHLNELYEQATGEKTPIRGGNLHQTDKELDSFGRNLVAERAGHSRESIASAYIGGKQ